MSRVVVLGSSGFDITIRLPRLPRPGETLLGGDLHMGCGGKGANQAIAARRAGAEVVFLTSFGNNDFARNAAENLSNEGIDLSFAKRSKTSPNQVALIFVAEDGQNLIGVAPGASLLLQAETVDLLPDSLFEPPAVLLASLEVPIEAVERGLRRARSQNMLTLVNPAPAAALAQRPDLLAFIDVLSPNEEEAALLCGREIHGIEEAKEAAILMRDRGVKAVIVTMGASGCLLVTEQGEWHIPAPEVLVVDTVGAGDSFSGVLATMLAEGKSLHEAATLACIAGSLAVTRPGAQGGLPTRSEIERKWMERAE